MKQLLVMRHAKSDWEAGQRDHERPLNPRGRTAAGAMGRALSTAGLVPDHAICSTAVRARSTLALAVEGGGWDVPVVHDGALYESSVAETLATVAAAPDVDRLLLVGHEPTWSALVGHLTGGAVAMRTGTVVVLDLLAVDWADVPTATAEIVSVLQPRHLPT